MTTKKDKLDEKFEASFEVPASLPDPIDTGSNKRPADKDQGEKAPKSLTKAQMVSGIAHASYKLSHPELTQKYREFFALSGENVSAEHNKSTIKSGGLKEDIDNIFEGADLSEEFKNKATTIFEAAVNAAIIAETARLDEEYETKLEEAVSVQIGTLSEALKKYLDHVAEEWLEENKLEVESGIRSDIAEAFLSGMKDLFVEHYVEIPDEAVDVVEALTSQVEELTAKLNESENAVIDAKKKLDEVAASKVLDVVAEGLTDSQKDKLITLAESIDFSDEETYKTKLTHIKEGLIEKKEVVPAADQLNEEVDLANAKKDLVMDPLVAAAVAAAKRR